MPAKTAVKVLLGQIVVSCLVGLGVAYTGSEPVLTHAAFAGGATLVAGLVVSLAAYRTVRRLRRPLREFSAVTTQIAGGDLAARTTYTAADEAGRLAASLNAMAEALAGRERTLEHSRDGLNALFELFDDLLFILDGQGRIQRVNPAVERRLGYRTHELKGQSLAALHPPELRDEAAAAIDRMLAGTASLCPIPLLAKDGSTIAVETKVARTRRGSEEFLSAISHDVSKRRRVEAALERVERERAAILEATSERIVVQDLQHNVTGASRGAAESARAEPADLIGRSCYEIWADRMTPCVGCPAHEAFTTGRPTQADMALAEGRVWSVQSHPVKDKRGTTVALVEVMGDTADSDCTTQARQAEHELRESEERYRLLADNITDIIWKIDAQWRFTYVSPAVVVLLGFAPSELLGKTFELFMTPASAQTAHSALAELLHNAEANPGAPRETRLIELELLRNDGSTVWSEVTASLLPDENGRIIGALGIARDITQRRRSDLALRLTQFSVDHAADSVFWITPEGRLTYVNEAACCSLGYSREELLGMSVADIGPDYPAARRAQQWEQLKQRRALIFETRQRTKDGRISPVEVTSSYLEYEGQEYEIAFARDITERKRAEQELRAAKEQAERAVEQVEGTKASVQRNAGDLAEALFQVELQKVQTETAMQAAQDANRLMTNILSSVNSVVIAVGENDRVTQWNAAAEATFGVPARHVIGTPIAECPIQWQDAATLEAISACRESGEPVRLHQICFTRPNGSVGLLSLVVNPMRDEAGHHVGFVLLGDDVTERSIMEQELARAQKLESVGALAAGIAHEINTPIQFVGDNTRFLSDSFAEFQQVLQSYHELKQAVEAQSELQELVARVAQAEQKADVEYLAEEIPKAIDQTLDGVARVAKIVRAMKDFSHPDQGEKAPADINHALDDTLTVARNELKYVADVVTDYDPELPLVPCYLSDLNQVFLNLLVNAAHAIAQAAGIDSKETPAQKGTITVGTRVEGNEAVIRISDTGTGIPEAIRGRVFDQFFTTKQVGKGTGQGLAIAHSVVVEKHGGSLTFETEVGKGTTFVVRLPL
jgi:PAS domain S-box-containing protein